MSITILDSVILHEQDKKHQTSNEYLNNICNLFASLFQELIGPLDEWTLIRAIKNDDKLCVVFIDTKDCIKEFIVPLVEKLSNKEWVQKCTLKEKSRKQELFHCSSVMCYLTDVYGATCGCWTDSCRYRIIWKCQICRHEDIGSYDRNETCTICNRPFTRSVESRKRV